MLYKYTKRIRQQDVIPKTDWLLILVIVAFAIISPDMYYQSNNSNLPSLVSCHLNWLRDYIKKQLLLYTTHFY